MIGTYASAALICAVSLLVGRAVISLAGRREWSWLEPAVGFGAVLTVTGLLARAPGHGTSATLGLAALVVAAAVIVWRGVRPFSPSGRKRTNADHGAPGAWREGLPVAAVVLVVLSIPFAVSGRWGLLGVGFNNDLGLHLAWAEWLRSGFGPDPDPGYPLGPHGLAIAIATVPGIGLAQAFLGEIVAIGVMTGLTALGALRGMSPGRRTLAAAMVALPYLAASYYAQAAFKETAAALLILAFAIYLTTFDAGRAARRGDSASGSPSPDTQPRARRAVSGEGLPLAALPPLALAGGIFFSYSFAGVAWPVAILALWSLTLPPVREALRPRALLRFLLRPLTLIALPVLAGLAVLVTIVGPFGFGSSFNKVAGSNTYGPVSPLEALGIWPTSNYRLDAEGGVRLPGLAGTISILALLVGVAWWVARREATIPIALGAAALLYLASLPFSGDYSQAKALMIAAPLAMLVALRPLLEEFPRLSRRAEMSNPGGRRDEKTNMERQIGPSAERGGRIGPSAAGWAVLAVAFIGGAAYSSFLALRDAPVGPPGHGAELKAFLPILHGEPVLYAGQDRYAAYGLLGADTHVPLVEFPDDAVSPNQEKPFDTGDAYSPIDFDSFSLGTLDRFPYVITGRAAWDSQAPPNFERVATTDSYVLWKRTGPSPENRNVLLEGTEAAAYASCAAPEVRILLAGAGRAGIFPDAVIGQKGDWEPGSILETDAETSQVLPLPPGRWNLSLQYFSPFELALSAPGFREQLKPALDGQRPNTISLGNSGQFWPAGRYGSKGGTVRFTITTEDPTWLQSLTGYDGKAYVGELVAVPAEPHRTVPLGQACNAWIDWYESNSAP
jgi:hypothetical protein